MRRVIGVVVQPILYFQRKKPEEQPRGRP